MDEKDRDFITWYQEGLSARMSEVIHYHKNKYWGAQVVANDCGVSLKTVHRWMWPSQTPTLDSLVLFSMSTGTSLDWLLYGRSQREDRYRSRDYLDEIRLRVSGVDIAEWWSARSLAKAKIPYAPRTSIGVIYCLRALKDYDLSKYTVKPAKRGKLFGSEYHFSALPLHWQMSIIAKSHENTCMEIKPHAWK